MAFRKITVTTTIATILMENENNEQQLTTAEFPGKRTLSELKKFYEKNKQQNPGITMSPVAIKFVKLPYLVNDADLAEWCEGHCACDIE